MAKTAPGASSPRHISGKELTAALDVLCDLIACQHTEVQWLRRQLQECRDNNSTIVVLGEKGTGTKAAG